MNSFDSLISSAPKSPGVYKMFGADGRLLYVGKAKNLARRLKQYKDGEKLEYHKIVMRRQVLNVEWIALKSEAEALIMEQRLIKTEKPKYNIVLADDKMYPYLALSIDKYPRLYKFRSKITPKKNVFGPFPFIADMDETFRMIQKICRIRTCADFVFKAHKKRPCLLYQTGLCSAPCSVQQDDYAARVRAAKGILKGHIRPIVAGLRKKMTAAAHRDCRDFEAAAKYRDEIRSLQSTCANADGTGKIGGIRGRSK